MKDLLLVIDMQKVYTAGGHWQCEGTEAAAERIRGLIREKGEELEVVFTRFDPPVNPDGVWAEYNQVNAEVNADEAAAEMMGCFADMTGEGADKYPLYSKSIYSAADIPELQEALYRADRIAVCGVVAECCVLATVMALIDKGLKVVYLTDAVAGESAETASAVELVLAGLDPLHVCRMTVEDFISN
ncbi:MAG: cysteine hydrolase [Clostridiales bacterium]|nr:cysteine hydrolase [Candidatus Crickella merdequi]